MCEPSAHQLFRQRQNVVILAFADHVLEMLHPRGGVHFFRHNQRLGIKIERHRAVCA